MDGRQGRSVLSRETGRVLSGARDIQGEKDREKGQGSGMEGRQKGRQKGYGRILVLVRLINLAPSLFRSIGSVSRITLNAP